MEQPGDPGTYELMEKLDKNQIIVGLEFLKLTHWDRYILNENLAIMENELFPNRTVNQKVDESEENKEIWRGNRRRHYRLDTRNSNLVVELDFRPAKVKRYDAKVLDLSSAGCQILLPSGESIEMSTRIPRVQIAFAEQKIVFRAKVIYSNSSGIEKFAVEFSR